MWRQKILHEQSCRVRFTYGKNYLANKRPSTPARASREKYWKAVRDKSVIARSPSASRSRPTRAHPLFAAFIDAALQRGDDSGAAIGGVSLGEETVGVRP